MSSPELTIDAPSWTVAELSQWQIQQLEGKLLTIIDAIGLQNPQAKAIKNLVSQALWGYVADLEKVEITLSEKGKTYKAKDNKFWDMPQLPPNKGGYVSGGLDPIN